jgi:membrane protein
MRVFVRRGLLVLRTAVSDLSRIDAFTRAAALAFYAATALVPVLIVAIMIAGLLFGRDAARGAIVGELSELLGTEAAELIQGAILSASERESGELAAVLSIGALLITSSGVFIQLRSGLYQLWGIKPVPEALWRFIRARLTSLALVFALGLMLLISLSLEALVTAFAELINSYVPFGTAVLRTANALISFTLTALLFGAMYKILTLNIVSTRNAALAAIVTALLFQLGRFIIGTYLGSSNIGSSFGVAGALIVLLSWIYYSAVIVFFGGALTRSLTMEQEERALSGDGDPPATARQ